MGLCSFAWAWLLEGTAGVRGGRLLKAFRYVAKVPCGGFTVHHECVAGALPRTLTKTGYFNFKKKGKKRPLPMCHLWATLISVSRSFSLFFEKIQQGGREPHLPFLRPWIRHWIDLALWTPRFLPCTWGPPQHQRLQSRELQKPVRECVWGGPGGDEAVMEWELVVFFLWIVTLGLSSFPLSLHICSGVLPNAPASASLPTCSASHPPPPHFGTGATYLLSERTFGLQCAACHRAREPRNRPFPRTLAVGRKQS